MIQMSAPTRDQGNRAPSLWSWAMHDMQLPPGMDKKKGKRGAKKHPSNTHHPAPNTCIFLLGHRTTAPPRSRHSWALSSQGNPERQPPAQGSHRCPSPQKRSSSQPRWKRLQRPSSTTPPFPQGEDRPREGAELSEPLDKSVAERRRPADTAQASGSVQRGFRCLERPQLLHRSSQAAPLRSSLLLPTLGYRGCHQPRAGSPPSE